MIINIVVIAVFGVGVHVHSRPSGAVYETTSLTRHGLCDKSEGGHGKPQMEMGLEQILWGLELPPYLALTIHIHTS